MQRIEAGFSALKMIKQNGSGKAKVSLSLDARGILLFGCLKIGKTKTVEFSTNHKCVNLCPGALDSVSGPS